MSVKSCMKSSPLTSALYCYTGWCRETVKFEIIRKKRRKLTKLYLILIMYSTRVEISLGITF
jgi:hypothetical protein